MQTTVFGGHWRVSVDSLDVADLSVWWGMLVISGCGVWGHGLGENSAQPFKEKNTQKKAKWKNNLWNAGNILVKFIYPKCEVLLYRIWRSNFFLSHRLRVYINKISPHRPLREFHGLIQDLIRATAFFNAIKKTRGPNLTLLLSIFKKNL